MAMGVYTVHNTHIHPFSSRCNGLHMDTIRVTVVLIFLGIKDLGAGGVSCPSGTKLLPLPDGSQDCLHCTQCPHGQEEKTPCSHATDTVCASCQQGYFYNNSTKKCRTCTTCDPGHYIAIACTKYADASCSVCARGTFSDSENETVCRKCTVCESDVFQECVKTYDTVCSPAHHGLLFIGLMVSVLISVLLNLSCCVVLIRRKAWTSSRRRSPTMEAIPVAEIEPLHGPDNKNELTEQLIVNEGTDEPIKDKYEDELQKYMTQMRTSVGALVYQDTVVTVFCVGDTKNRYIMTAYSRVKDLITPSKINDLEVTFEEIATKRASAGLTFKIMSTAFVDKNNDIAILKVSNSSELPDALVLLPDELPPHDNVGFITFGKKVPGKKRFELLPIISQESEEFREIVESCTIASSSTKRGSSALSRKSSFEGTTSEQYQTRVFWKKSTTAMGPGSPGFVGINGKYGVACMFTYTVPDVNGNQQNMGAGKSESGTKVLLAGPSMSALYRQSHRRSRFLDELFEPKDLSSIREDAKTIP